MTRSDAGEATVEANMRCDAMRVELSGLVWVLGALFSFAVRKRNAQQILLN